jgi:hypothetical protein
LPWRSPGGRAPQVCHGGCRPRSTEDQSDLTEVIAGAESPDDAAVDADLDLAVGDHEELVASFALLGENITGRRLSLDSETGTTRGLRLRIAPASSQASDG